jgi:hypothetical protein
MPVDKILPPDAELEQMVLDGMTHAEIAAEIERFAGVKVHGPAARRPPLSDVDQSRLSSWLAMLERERVIIAYCPEDEDGFLYVDEGLRWGPDEDIPVREKVLRLAHIASVRICCRA